MAMASEDVDIKVYHNLLKSVNKNLPLLHRYYRDRKKMLGYKSMHMYDVYTTVCMACPSSCASVKTLLVVG